MADNFDLRKYLAENRLREESIKDDIKLLINDLIEKKIITKGYSSSTGSGAKGKNKVYVDTDNLTYDSFNKLIKNNYKQTGTTSLSSNVFYSPKGNVYFYFYSDGGNGKFVLLVRRKNLKS